MAYTSIVDTIKFWNDYQVILHSLPLPNSILFLLGHVLGTYFQGSSDLGPG